MSESSPEFVIEQNEAARRFELKVDNHMARVDYVMPEPTRIIFTHTIVPYSLKGRGIASALAEHVLDYARERNLNVVPQCPFIRSYIEQHPEYQDLVVKSDR